jgi:hypothetical protein
MVFIENDNVYNTRRARRVCWFTREVAQDTTFAGKFTIFKTHNRGVVFAIHQPIGELETKLAEWEQIVIFAFERREPHIDKAILTILRDDLDTEKIKEYLMKNRPEYASELFRNELNHQ